MPSLRRLLPLAAAPLLPLSPLAAQDGILDWFGGTPGQSLGMSVAGAGDVDGDGRNDLLIGIPGDDTAGQDAGAVLVLSADGVQLYRYDGATAGARLGHDVATAGDLDQDGFADFMAGSPYETNTLTEQGSVRVWSGRTGALMYVFYGLAAEDHLGMAVSGAGDLNGDGWLDLMAGAPDADPAGAESGAVHLWDGRTGVFWGQLPGAAAGDRFGFSLGWPGDLTGDGQADIAIGIPGDDTAGPDAGAVELLSGANGSVLLRWTGAAAGDAFGHAVFDAGDIDQDGTGDLIVGAPFFDGAGVDRGEILVFSGADGSQILARAGAADYDYYGFAVGNTGDFDRDGWKDVVAGAPGDGLQNPGAGYVEVLSGASGSPLLTLTGAASLDRFGYDVAGTGDTNLDAYRDLLVGAPGDDTGGMDAGSAHLFNGLLRLRLLDPDPGLAGQVNLFTVEEGTAGWTVHFFGSLKTGFTPVGVCAGTGLDLLDPVALGQKTVNASGTASIAYNVPIQVQGRQVFLQALEAQSCSYSNRLPFVFQ